MKYPWREWDDGRRASISGWDPDTAVVFYVGFILVVAPILLPYFLGSEAWLPAILMVATAIVFVFAACHLVIFPDGYRLWRLWFGVIPWYVRRFTRQAVIATEENWCDDIGIFIHDADESFEQRVVFGTRSHSLEVVHRIHQLSYELGVRATPPTPLPMIGEISLAIPSKTRRMKRLARRKSSHEK